MHRILLLLGTESHLDQIRSSLAPRYAILTRKRIPDDIEFDLAVVDSVTLAKSAERLLSAKAQARPFFLPMLFVGARTALAEIAMDHQGLIDDILLEPLDEFKVNARVKSLLHARQLSLDSGRFCDERVDRADAMLAVIMQSTTDAVFVKDLAGRYLQINLAGAADLQLGVDEILGKDDRALFSPETAEAIQRRDREIMETGRVQSFEETCISLSGHKRHYHTVKGPVRDRHGNIFGVFAIARDIGERLRSEEELRRSEARFRSLVEASSQIVWLADPAGNVVEVSNMPSGTTGLSDEKLKDWGWLDALHPEDRERVEAAWKTSIANQTMHHVEYRLRGANDVYRHYQARGVPVRNKDGSVREWIGVLVDIDERRRAEDALRLAKRAMESGANGVAILDLSLPKRAIVYVNPAFERITGYTARESIGRDLDFLLGSEITQRGVEELHAALSALHECTVTLKCFGRDGSPFWNELSLSPVPNELGVVKHFVAILNDVTERKQHEHALEHQANYDMLTGLPNRMLMQDRLSQAIAYAKRADRMVEVMFIDIDNFKIVNDSLGHAYGDALLTIVAQRISASVRDTDTVARVGGDEFVAIVTDVASPSGTRRLHEKLLELLNEPVFLGGQEIFVTASVGVTLFPSGGDTPEVLIRNADAAMYRAKQQGRNALVAYQPDMNARSRARLETAADLRHAIERNELVLHYQPKIRASDGAITGSEALIRWNHPKKGMLAPADFIPLAEEAGMIIAIGNWVLQTACRQNSQWKEKGLGLKVAVNLSPIQFRDANLAANLKTILKANRAAGMEIEITESMLMENPEKAVKTMRDLKKMGIRILLDDFGTGYSSLSYLKRFPIDALKIDKSFVRDITTDPDDAAIVTAVAVMAHSLHLEVIAEGVETEAQLAFLVDKHCDAFQGFYFSPALPADEFEALVRGQAFAGSVAGPGRDT